MQGVKHDTGKARVDLVPVEGIMAAARAFGYGAEKYSPWNWAGGLAWLRLYGATLRHLFAWVAGEAVDEESGLHHLDHALASLLMLQAHVEGALGDDDRPASRPEPFCGAYARGFSPEDEPEGPEGAEGAYGRGYRIAIQCGGETSESSYFEGQRYATRATAASALAASTDAHHEFYAVEWVDA